MRLAPILALPLMLLAGPMASAQPATTITVQLSNFKFAPSTIIIDHGRSYVLRLVNAASGGHDFTAPGFFAAAKVAAADRQYIAGGVVEVPPGRTIDIRLTAPATGRYKVKCTHRLHKMLGMSGVIIVR